MMSSSLKYLVDSLTFEGKRQLEPIDLPSSLDRWKIECPNIPFHQKIFTPLRPKTVLQLQGRVPKNPRRFSVNFLIENKKGSDNAFHFNPRFDEHSVVCNSRHNESWEDQVTIKGNPFDKNADLTFEVFITEQEYLVSVNRMHFCSFRHRIPLREVNKIEVNGDIVLYSVELTKRDFYPPSAFSDNNYIHENLLIPFKRAFLDPITPSTVINIRGSVPEKAVRFRIDFCTSWNDDADVGFHFNPRFDDDFIACNSKHGGKWAQEVANGFSKVPFKKGHSFFMDIYAEENEFLVSIFGVFFCKFEYRIPISKIKVLSISGDLELKWVNFTSASSPLERKEAQNIVFDNVVTPFRRAFLDPIIPKTDILVCGIVDKEAIRFSVNFCVDPSRGNDIAFHFNPRFDQNYVARNSRFKDHWATEESHAIKRNPFKRGEPFILEFFVTRHEFLVSVNGSHFCSYSHRVPPLEIQQFEIDGDLSLSRVELSMKDYYPSFSGVNEDLKVFNATECPITFCLPAPLTFGQTIEIAGRVKLLPIGGFYISLQVGRVYWPHPQVGFHASLRLNEFIGGSGAHITHHSTAVLNTWKDAGWSSEKEIRLEDGLLVPGGPFCLAITCGNQSFSVELCNRPLGKLKYALDLKLLDTLHIQGEILVDSIEIT